MSARHQLAPRVRVVGLAIVMAVTALGLEAAPAPRPAAEPERVASAPIPFGLGPDPVLAGYCASNPAFTGKLTQTLQNSGTPPTIDRITTPTVYGWISNVDAAWSCTLYRRYSGLTWNVTSSGGIFAWGTIINSTSVSCNWAIGSTDYLKANDSTTCPTSDTHHAMAVALSAERTYTANVAHTAVGQFSFVHSDCDTTPYYGANPIKGTEPGGVSYSTGISGNRPGTNCDPIGLDNMGIGQTVIYDSTAPAIGFDTPATGTGPVTVTSAAYTVQFDATDALAGFGGSNGWTLTRQLAAYNGSACGTFVNDTGAGAVTTGTTSALNQTTTQYLPSGSCYRWTLTATDQNGNVAGTVTSGSVFRSVNRLLGLGGYQHFERWDLGAGDTLSVNAATGNVVVSHPVVSLPIRGGSFDLGLTYNSQDVANAGTGRGWRLDVMRRLSIDGSGNVTFIDADGARYSFTNPVGTGTVTYTRPNNLYATLVRDTTATPDRFTLTYRDQSKDVFDELSANLGYLKEQRDRFGNTVTFGYSGTNISTATDPAGRTMAFGWTTYAAGDRLTSITDWANVSGGVVQASGSGNRVHEFFYDTATGELLGWDRPLAGSGSCPTAASHRVCLTYTNGLLSAVNRRQTYTTLSSGALSTLTRNLSTTITYAGADARGVTDAAGAASTISRPANGQLRVVRPGTPASETTYGLVAASDSLGRVQSIWRTLGASQIEQRTTYDATYPIEPASVTDNHGALLSTPARTVSYTYVASSMGLVSRVTEPLDGTHTRWTDYTYNANNDVTQKIVSRQGDGTLRTTTRYCYTTSGCATNATDLLLRSTIEHYVDGTAGGANGHVEDVTTSYQVDAYGQRTRETRANYAAGGTLLDQAATGWTYDSSGNVTAEIANYANGTVSNPGDDITPNTTTNARTDLTTVHAYDTAGNRISTADPRRAIEAAKATALGSDDYVTRATFDAQGRRLTEKTPTTPGIAITQKTATTVYDEFDLARHVTDFGGLVAATLYDEVGRATATYEDPAGAAPAAQTSATTYDAQGRILTAKDRRQVGGVGGETQTTYDALGRTTSTKEGVVGGVPVSVTAYGYDALDRRVTEETGAGTGTGQLTTHTYDLGGRTTKTDDEFTCASTTYDWRDLAQTVSEGLDPGTCTGTAQRVITHAYDAMGRRTSSTITAGEGQNDVLAASTYDAAGRQRTTSATKAGATTASTFTHNPLDQIVAEVRSDAGTPVSWTKANADPAGNPTDRCVWNTDPGSEWCKPVGQSFTTAPSVHTTTGYDARNGRTSLRIPGAGETTYDPDHNYAVDLVYLPTRLNGSNEVIAEHRTDHEYDERHRLTSISHSVCPVTPDTHTCTATPVATGSVSYVYDDNDNRTRVNEANGAGSLDRHYCYDGLNRLISTRSATGCSTGLLETFEYDAAGNRTRASLSAPQYFRYSPAGQLCEQATSLAACPADPATWAIRYDDTGRTTLAAGWTLAYDGEGRLASACKTAGCATGDMVTMRYDASGRRVELITRPNGGTATTVTFRYQGDALAQELTAGSVTRTYVTDEAGGIVKLCDPDCTGSNPQYLVTWNGHGDAQALWRINADGTLTLANSFTYGTWGTPATATHNGAGDLGFRFRYVGRFGVAWDNAFGLGLAHMGVRHYSPALGRFLQPDPSALEDNLYGYASGQPTSTIDPQGTWGKKLCWCGARGPGLGAAGIRSQVGPVRPPKGQSNPWNKLPPAIQEALRAPADVFLNSRGMALRPSELRQLMSQFQRAGWQFGRMRKSSQYPKGGVVWEEISPSGSFAGRRVQYHPGTPRHNGGQPYWKVSSPEYGKIRVPDG